ncbi:uracil phosphoribosyltransferase [Synchytrium endobioticum]|uniref:uracil phosphoribosyltransferase n=1 Tax=Synchytrium endobioticum TaxID=286115 RepID=A0A507DRG2_9FUNG|nr:uracil phosphoribosyltransferase [Synchytrium endobioticum]TPX53538.1 uracil phosphoribosyltransferase [Synchytrium endobioticum]
MDHSASASSLPLPATVKVINHPLMASKMSLLRDRRIKPKQFRELVNEVSLILAIECTSSLDLMETKTLESPMGRFQGVKLADKIAIFPILRAGLGMVHGFLTMLPAARVHHLGLYREKTTLLPVEYYNKLPLSCNVDLGIVVDPMLATAGSAIAAVNMLKDWGLKRIKLCCICASSAGVSNFRESHPDVDLYVGVVDEELSDHGYILPGLGDAGDRLYKTFF